MLNNMVAAISGAAGRIGSAFARAVAANDGRVVLGDVAEEKGRELERELGEDNALYIRADLTEPREIDRFLEQGIEKFGTVDAAVHCAYPTSEQWGTRFEDLQPNLLREDLNKQLGGAILFSQRVIRHFREHGHGNLIYISSIQGVAAPKFEHYEGTEMISPIEYSAIKSGIIAITRYLAKYSKGQNIRVNCISPGGILTNQPESFLEKYRGSCTGKGMLDAGDLIGTLLYLLSDHSRYVNGQNIIVDDGWSL
ncbi:oxidoreductase [Acidobacteria bacterium AH-259-D05]|nr:oxidoreductase [Acidobacteria bacterium AH-259-D05]